MHAILTLNDPSRESILQDFSTHISIARLKVSDEILPQLEEFNHVVDE